MKIYGKRSDPADMDDQNGNIFGETVCEARTVSESRSEKVKPVGQNGSVFARLPVVISQTRVHMDVEAKVRLPDNILDIRNCDRKAFVTRCRLFNQGNSRFGKIYIDGYIRESIEYLESADRNNSQPSGTVRFAAVRIPFECAAKVEYCIAPILKNSNGFIPVELYEDSRGYGGSALSAEQAGLGGDCQDKLSCELENIEIRSLGMTRDPDPINNGGYLAADMSGGICEHIMVDITFILMQRQMVYLPKYY